MQRLGSHAVGELLSALEVVDVDERVVEELVADLLALEPSGEPVVAVHTELETEGCPGGHTQVAKPQFGIDEVEVVVEAASGVGLDERFARGLVVPRPERGAALHGAEDVDQTRMRAALGNDLLDTILFAERLDATNELDLEAMLGGLLFGVVPDRFTQRLRELGEVEDADASLVQLPRHRSCVRDVG